MLRASRKLGLVHLRRVWTAAKVHQAPIPKRQLSNSVRPSVLYDQLVQNGSLKMDEEQKRLIEKYLDNLHIKLENYELPKLEYEATEQKSGHSADGGVDLNKNNDKNNNIPDKLSETSEPTLMKAVKAQRDLRDGKPVAHQADDPSSPQVSRHSKPVEPIFVPRGLYLHGHVGTGKSMLMDLFFNSVNVPKKRRVHFHEFMLEVHQGLQLERKNQLERFGRSVHIDLDPRKDIVGQVAASIASECSLLCFDEFQVTDIADALIMRKLFSVFFSRGVVVVATSNTHPKNLYSNGVNRTYFLPFLDMLCKFTRVVKIRSSTDYRRLGQPLQDGSEVFLHPITKESTAQIRDVFKRLAGDNKPKRMVVPIMMGRSLEVDGSLSGVCRVTFHELCAMEKSAADYKALCEHFSTVVLESIPQLDDSCHDQARRFITLVDELYEHRTRLLCTCAVQVDDIFLFDQLVPKDAEEQGETWTASGKNISALEDLTVAFRRAVSRLNEMKSEQYLIENRRYRDQRLSKLEEIQ